MKTKIKKQNISQPNMFCFVKTEKINKKNKSNNNKCHTKRNNILKRKNKKTFLYIK